MWLYGFLPKAIFFVVGGISTRDAGSPSVAAQMIISAFFIV